MIRQSIAVGLLAFTAALLAPAHASQPEPAAYLVCKGEEFAVRFNLGWEIEPMAEPFASKWKGAEMENDGRCILSTGQKVILKWNVLPGYGWGAGGADSPATFAVWLDGRLVSAGAFKSGYGEPSFYLNNLFYSPGRLTTCSYVIPGKDWLGANGPFTCTDKPFDIAAQRADWNAPDFDDPRGGEMTFTTSGSAAFCRQFIRPQEDITHWAGQPPPPVFTFVNRGKDTKEMLAIERAKVEFVAFEELPPGIIDGMDHPAIAHFDAFGTGAPQTAINLSGDYKQFRGSFVMVRDGEATPEEISALWKLRSGGQFNEHFQREAETAGWHHLGGKLTPFTWHTIFRMDGKLYVMAVPEAAYYTTNPTPTAVLYEPFAAGKMRLAAEVCTFQLTSF